jgi:hypothetical protein
MTDDREHESAKPERDDPESSGPALTCFAIGPIGSRHAPHGSPERETYEESIRVMEDVIEPACTAVGLPRPVRADKLTRAGEITEQIFRRLRNDDVVIADLTGANANVMYELGLRHTRNKLTVQIGEFKRLPFDVNVIRTIQFSRSESGLIQARDELTEILSAGLAGEYDPVTATRIWGEGDDQPPEPDGDGEDGGGPDDPEPPAGGGDYLLDVLGEAEERVEDLLPALEAVGALIEELARLAEASTADIERRDAAGQGMRGRLQAAATYASGLDKIAGRLETQVDRYVKALRSVSAGNLVLISQLEEEPTRLEDPDAQSFALAIRGLAKVTRDSMSALASMVDSIQDNAKLARVLREPSDRLTAALTRVAEATSTVDEWDRRLQSLGVPAPPDDWESDAPDERGESNAPDAQGEGNAPDARGDGEGRRVDGNGGV